MKGRMRQAANGWIIPYTLAIALVQSLHSRRQHGTVSFTGGEHDRGFLQGRVQTFLPGAPKIASSSPLSMPGGGGQPSPGARQLARSSRLHIGSFAHAATAQLSKSRALSAALS